MRLAARLARGRVRTDALVVVVVALLAVLATTLLATLAVLAQAAEKYGLRQSLSEAAADEVATTVRATPLGDQAEDVAAQVDGLLATAFEGMPTAVDRSRTSTPYDVRLPGGELGAQLTMATGDRAEDHLDLVAGRLPGEPAGSEVEVAVPKVAAEDLDLELGSKLPLITYLDRRATVRVVGVYEPLHTEDPFWRMDDLGGRGVSYVRDRPPGGVFVRPADWYGPLFTHLGAFEQGAVMGETLYWTVTPKFSSVLPDDVASLETRVDDLAASLDDEIRADVRGHSVTTLLPLRLEAAQRYVLVSRSAVVLAGLQLLVLAVATLTLTGRLLLERRETEQALLYARGGSRSQLIAPSVVEAVLLAAVAFAAGPLLARVLYSALASGEAATRAGMDVDPGLPLAAWLASGLGALALLIVLLAPLLRRGESIAGVLREGARPSRRSRFQRAGADVALVVLAGLGFYQLREYGTVVSPDAGMQLDPILVAAPAIGLLAASLLVLRALPLVGRALELLTARSRRLAVPLAGWEVSRRAQRYAGSVLLLALALAVGVSTVSYGATWAKSQRDQADFTVGTDVRVSELTASPLAQASALGDVQGAIASLPVTHRKVALGVGGEVDFETAPEDREAKAYPVMVAGDAAEMASALRLRGDLADAPIAALLAGVAANDGLPAIELPGEPRRIALDVTANSRLGRDPGTVAVSVVLEDAHSVRVPTEFSREMPADKRRHRVLIDVGALADNRDIAYPLRISAMDIAYRARDTATPDTEGPLVDTAVTVHTSQSVTGENWAPVRAPGFTWTAAGFPGAPESPLDSIPRSVDVLPPDGATVATEMQSGALGGRVLVTSGRDAPLPAIASSDLLANTALRVDDEVHVAVGAAVVKLEVAGVVDRLPSVSDPDGGLLVDAAALKRAMLGGGSTETVHDEWWISAPEDEIRGVAARLSGAQAGVVQDRITVRDELLREPLRVGAQLALILSLLAAIALALAGFGTHAAVSVRERRVEFGQLRALGAGRRSLMAVVFAEHVLLTVFGVAAGVAVGLLLTQLVAPLVSLTAAGGTPVPAVLIEVPWHAVAMLAAEGVAVLAVVALVVVVTLRRNGVVAEMRAGGPQ